jgi:hypothetical protein
MLARIGERSRWSMALMHAVMEIEGVSSPGHGYFSMPEDFMLNIILTTARR